MTTTKPKLKMKRHRTHSVLKSKAHKLLQIPSVPTTEVCEYIYGSPRNGGVLALVSKPSFDGNLFVNGISTKAYSALRDSPDTPLLNRAIQGQYPPGSTVKPMLALTGLDQFV